ncbi:transcriptional regulator [Streptomyces sp. NPDC026673]|uniref:transcriptional regulator n=1 Tax=Streptomyces sp. NPDC026673 TaxID=3155724 RepID=UPI0033E12483
MTGSEAGLPALAVRSLPRRTPARGGAPAQVRAGVVGAYAFTAALARLAEAKASGALYGSAGAVYLRDGAIVHAESPCAPDLGVRLMACGLLSPDQWREAVTTAGAERGVGGHLVDTGRVARGELELCHLLALFDAAYFTLLPDSEPDRFQPGATSRLGPISGPVPAQRVAREAQRRRAQLERAWPWDDTDAGPVVPRTGGEARGGRARAPTPAQLAVLAAADGSRTPVQIAWHLGRSAFATLLDVRRLAAIGRISTPVRAEAPPAPAPPAAVSSPAPVPRAAVLSPAPAPAPVPLPPAPEPPPLTRGGPQPAVLSSSDPSVALLLRLRAALEARL